MSLRILVKARSRELASASKPHTQSVALAIAALGDRNPTYLTHREIDSTIALAPEIRWVGTEDARIDGYDGLWVLPGTPYRHVQSALETTRFAREDAMPILGTCGG